MQNEKASDMEFEGFLFVGLEHWATFVAVGLMLSLPCLPLLRRVYAFGQEIDQPDKNQNIAASSQSVKTTSQS